MTHRLSSRKFIVSMTIVVATSLLAGFSKMTGAEVSTVFVAVVVGYNAANAWVTGKGQSVDTVG